MEPLEPLEQKEAPFAAVAHSRPSTALRLTLTVVGAIAVGLLAVTLISGLRRLPPVTVSFTMTTASPTPTAAASYCLLPTFDQGYIENPGVSPVVHCVNTGAVATAEDIAAGRYAAQCFDQLSKVPCYHPCFTITGTPKSCPEGAPPPTPKPSSN